MQSSSIGFAFSYPYLLSVNLFQYSSLASPDLAFAKSITALQLYDGATRDSRKTPIFTFSLVYLFF